MHELTHEFASRKVSPWGGLKYFLLHLPKEWNSRANEALASADQIGGKPQIIAQAKVVKNFRFDVLQIGGQGSKFFRQTGYWIFKYAGIGGFLDFLVQCNGSMNFRI